MSVANIADPLPSVTIIIPARPEQVVVPALEASGTFDYPLDRLEIILARGVQPSVQRNAALRAASGELIYFLDDDSRPTADNLKRAVRHFADPQVQMVGGPNLCPPEAPILEQAFALTMGSGLAFGPSRARYVSVGKVRSSGEKQLILCNLMARRDALLELGGFDEALYPNEENALMDALQSKGGRLVYDPEFVVYRRPRKSLCSFIKMLFNYGRGRAEQFRRHPTAGSLLNFAPPLFCLFLFLLPFLPAWTRWSLAAYGAALFVQALALRKGLLGLATMPLVFLTHLFYGIGFGRGLLLPLKSTLQGPVPAVKLERLKPI